MDCDFCDDEASIFLTQVEGNANKSVHLCQACAQDKNLLQEHNLLNALDESFMPTDSAPTLSCSCGFTAEQLISVGRLGCSKCYHVFADLLTDRISEMQAGTFHTGKTLSLEENADYLRDFITRTKSQMNALIQEERFEEVNLLKSKLLKLESQLSQL